MKFTLAMLSLVFSINAFAFSFGMTTIIPSDGSVYIPETQKIQAQVILNDAQEMLNTGDVSVYLSQKIRETQALNDDFSEEEALDILIESAQEILSK